MTISSDLSVFVTSFSFFSNRDINNVLGLDLGPEKEYFPLKGNCYEYTDREYTYKLCPFERASQRSKNGGAETSLGYVDFCLLYFHD